MWCVASLRCSALPPSPNSAEFPGSAPATLPDSGIGLHQEKVTVKERQAELRMKRQDVSSQKTRSVHFIQPPISQMGITEARRGGWNDLHQGQGIKHGLFLPQVLCVVLIQKIHLKSLLVATSSKAGTFEPWLVWASWLEHRPYTKR